MGNVFNKFVGFITGEDDEELENEYINEEDEREKEKPYRKRMREYEDVEDNRKSQSKLISMSSSRAAMQNSAMGNNNKVIITQPHQYEEVKEIVDYLKNRRSVIVNLEFVNKEEAKKIVDFLSGASYGIDGNIQKISNFIFFIAPSNVEVTNETNKEDLRNRMSFSWIKQ